MKKRKHNGSQWQHWRVTPAAAVILLAGVMLIPGSAFSQGGGYYDDYPPREYMDPNYRQPRGGGGYGQQQDYGQQGGYGQQPSYSPSPHDLRCRSLEQQLAGDWMRSQSQDQQARLNDDIRETERAFQLAQYEADRQDCYEDMFIFGRSLRRTPKCLELNQQIEDARRRLSDLRQQRDNLTNSSSRRARQDELIAELARNGCGENYQREAEARRRETSFNPFSLWEDSDSSSSSSSPNYQQRPGDQPFGTYRTLCVRLCDGFYFPISYSTLQSNFHEDEAKCHQKCASPAELYVYRNPGEDVEQAVSLNGQPYKDLPNAFRNRKQYIKGCSCNASEYSPEEIAKSEKALKEQAAEARRTASNRGKGENQAPAAQQPAANTPPAQAPAGNGTPETKPQQPRG